MVGKDVEILGSRGLQLFLTMSSLDFLALKLWYLTSKHFHMYSIALFDRCQSVNHDENVLKLSRFGLRDRYPKDSSLQNTMTNISR
jgi:hypothetical protein